MFLAFGLSQSSEPWDFDNYLIQRVRGWENVLVRGRDRKGYSKGGKGEWGLVKAHSRRLIRRVRVVCMCVTDELSASSGDVSPTHIVRRCESAPTFFFFN
jgi:hypothetical protein